MAEAKKCKVCGLSLRGEKPWAKMHRACVQIDYNRRSRKQSAMKQVRTKAQANATYEPWTKEQDEFVLRTDITLVDIARELGRTFGAVKNRRQRLRGTKPQH